MPAQFFPLFVFFAGLIGLCIGSFLNVVIYRLPNGMSLAYPPSHCPVCGYKLKWYDNIPVVSYIILGGKCRSCKTHISFRYTVVELSCAAMWIACALIFGKTNVVYSLLAMVVCSVCICVFFIDLEHMIIYDRFQIVLAAAGVIMIFFDREYDWLSHVIGLLAAAVLFVGVALIVGRILKREAMGGGDVKLAMASGLILGWQKFLLMLLISSISASVYMLIRRKKDGESREIPFAPFLTSGLVVAMILGNMIIKVYLSLIGL